MKQPTNLAGKIAHLKTLLVNAEEFSEPMTYFFDALVDDPAFLAKGKKLRDEQIESRFYGVLEVLRQRMAPDTEIKPRTMTLAGLKQYGFAHGGFTFGHLLGVTFYFRDLDMGLCALTAMDGSSMTLFSRFSVYDQVDPSKNFQVDRPGRRH
ncbi:hypothetical protein CKO42_13555 [Lamprobacter modestohalophilus]|uniref:Uncharacterized protein n=1 Tax=Lamprobacter modestohalophilus TaxID=1064514 RepID=A0A9X0WA64_9GAMM|nr:hypothetical protein [Lamprobacter modestohalophilus]MBK1619445.1 hypothetical protein [Lamprobacter modestohalophilus]